uniref:Uncharacterized protein n=1 Tax=Sphaerodactylus townsendi TaxID=933632 RepID=A0ACB8EGW6_9SAUR
MVLETTGGIYTGLARPGRACPGPPARREAWGPLASHLLQRRRAGESVSQATAAETEDKGRALEQQLMQSKKNDKEELETYYYYPSTDQFAITGQDLHTKTNMEKAGMSKHAASEHTHHRTMLSTFPIGARLELIGQVLRSSCSYFVSVPPDHLIFHLELSFS